LYHSPNIFRGIKSRRLRWVVHVEGRYGFKILIGKQTYRKKTFRKDLKEIGINMRDWLDLAQDRDYWRALVNVALNHQVP